MSNNNEVKEIITKDLMTVPNALSFIRILLITPFVACFVTHNYLAATVFLVLSGLSDCFDGVIARRFHQESEMGKILDPLADKLTLIAVGVCLCFVEPFVIPLMAVMVIKDTLMLIGGSMIINKGIVPPKSAWYGKLSTILFYVSVVAIVAMAVFNYSNLALTVSMLGITLLFMLISLILYARKFFELIKQENDSEGDNI